MEDDRKTSHPAYGVIEISRTSSNHMRLFQSDFNHHHFITLRISTADAIESYGVAEHVFPKERIIEVALSEAQFARMITTPNMGCGTPCTLEHVRVPASLQEYADGKQIPPVEKEDIRETHADKIGKICRERLADLDEIQEQLATWRQEKHRPTLSELDQLIRRMEALHLASNFAYLQQVLEEHMEATIEEGRTEIESHVSMLAQRLGLDAVQRQSFPELPHERPPAIETTVGEENATEP